MDDFTKYLDKNLEDPGFKTEWDALDTGTKLVRAMLDARLEAGMTQEQLSKKTGVNQSNLSRIERGVGNPSMATIERIAALSKKVSISIV